MTRRRLLLALLTVVAFTVGDIAPYLAWREVHGLHRGGLTPPERERLERALHRNPLHPDSWLRRIVEGLRGGALK